MIKYGFYTLIEADTSAETQLEQLLLAVLVHMQTQPLSSEG